MKDFYDIYYLANSFEFDGRKLQEAIIQTLQNRGTIHEKDSFERILALADNADMRVKWNYFIKTIKNKKIMFYDVIINMEHFLKPVYDAIIEENEFFGWWNPKNYKWGVIN